MPPTSTPTSLPPSPTGDHHDSQLSPRQVFGSVFWPLLFGGFLICLIWGALKFKQYLGGSPRSPLSNPMPPVDSTIPQMTRIRGTPVLGHPLARMDSVVPPPPAYTNPPIYGDIHLSHERDLGLSRPPEPEAPIAGRAA